MRISPTLLLTAGLALLLAVAALTPLVGAQPLDPWRGLTEICGQERAAWGPDGAILHLRLLRLALGLATGAALTVAGGCFQTLLRNPLATPYVLGLSSAAAFGAFLSLAFPALSFRLGPLTSVQAWALGFCLLDLAFIWSLSRRAGLQHEQLILAGVTLNFLFAALMMGARYLSDPYRLQSIDHWLIGSLQIASAQPLAVWAALALPGLALVLSQARALDQLAFDEEVARARGVNPGRTRGLCLLGASLATAATVSVAGPIGFVGLIIPHLLRRFTGPGHVLQFAMGILVGAAFLALADALGRALPLLGRATEIPVGIITTAIGGPAFLYILVRR